MINLPKKIKLLTEEIQKAVDADRENYLLSDNPLTRHQLYDLITHLIDRVQELEKEVNAYQIRDCPGHENSVKEAKSNDG